MCHVSAEVPATGLLHANDPPGSVPGRWPDWWGEDGKTPAKEKNPESPVASHALTYDLNFILFYFLNMWSQYDLGRNDFFCVCVCSIYPVKAYSSFMSNPKSKFSFFSQIFWNFPLISLLLSSSHPQGALNINERIIPQPRLLQLSVEKLSRDGAFLMDAGMVCFQISTQNHNFQADVSGLVSAKVHLGFSVLPHMITCWLNVPKLP